MSNPESELVAATEPDWTGTPSITYSGELLALKEPIPRIRTEATAPGCPEVDVICTPDTEPAKRS